MPTVLFALRQASLVLITLLLFISAATPRANAAEASVLVLGDSISAAFGMALEQGWVALLAQRLNADGAERPVINASISGDTSAGGLRRLPALLAEHRPKLLIIELGGNDGLRGYPTGELRENLTRMADLGREAGAEVLLLPMEIPPNLGSRYTRAFRQTFRDAAAASDSRLGPFILQDIATQPELMQEDGIHPSIEAQPMIVDHLQTVVEEMLLTSAES
ncbi:MAG: arylesterase [Pseudomonadota bacterium]